MLLIRVRGERGGSLCGEGNERFAARHAARRSQEEGSLVPSPNVGLARRILRGRVGGTATNRGAWNSPITRRLPSFKALITVVLEIPAALRAIMAVGTHQ